MTKDKRVLWWRGDETTEDIFCWQQEFHEPLNPSLFFLILDYLKTSTVPCHITKASGTTAISIDGTHCNTPMTLPQVLFRLKWAYVIA